MQTLLVTNNIIGYTKGNQISLAIREDYFMDIKECKGLCCFLGGILFGTAGIKLLSGKDAKKAYAKATAAALRVKDCVVDTAVTIQENAEDIYAEAVQINEDRAAEEEADIIDGDADINIDDLKEVVEEGEKQ